MRKKNKREHRIEKIYYIGRKHATNVTQIEKTHRECLEAEKYWLRKLPEIIAHSKKRSETWREEIEHKRRWKELMYG